LGNDIVIVDKEAKQIAFQMFKGNIVSPEEGLLSASEAYSISAEIARKSWQRHWDNESTGRYTYKSGAIQALYMKKLSSRVSLRECHFYLYNSELAFLSHPLWGARGNVCDSSIAS